jgi:hypothetical protein
MNLHYRQLHRIEIRIQRSDPQLAGMLGIFGRLFADQAMPSWEQRSFRKNRIRQAAGLLAEAATLAAAALAFLLKAVLAFVTVVVRGGARPPAPRRGRTRPPACKPGRGRAPAPKRDRAGRGRNAGDRPDPSGWS